MSESFDDFIEIRNTDGFPVIRADANSGEISVGRGGISGGTSGNLVLRNSLGQPSCGKRHRNTCAGPPSGSALRVIAVTRAK
jgi:hypothetical protein